MKFDDGDVRYYHRLPSTVCVVEKAGGHHCIDCGKYYSSLKRLETHRRVYHPQCVKIDSVPGGLSVIQDFLKCAVCLETMENAVTVKDCMHSFCEACIATCIRKKLKFCPTCKHPMNSVRSVKANTTLRDIVDALHA